MTTTPQANEQTTYTMQSSSLVSAPGIVRWAINGYAFKRDRKNLVNVIVKTWSGVPEEAAHALLAKRVPFTVTEEGHVRFVI